MCVVFHLLKWALLVILNCPSRLLKDTCIVYIMSDWRLILSTVVSILSCDLSINIISVKVVSPVESVINTWVIVGYSPGHSSLTCGVVDVYYTIHLIIIIYIRIGTLLSLLCACIDTYSKHVIANRNISVKILFTQQTVFPLDCANVMHTE